MTLDPILAEGGSQMGHVRVERVPCRLRGLVPPDGSHEALGRYPFVRGPKKKREGRSSLGTTKGKRLITLSDLEWSQDPKLQSAPEARRSAAESARRQARVASASGHSSDSMPRERVSSPSCARVSGIALLRTRESFRLDVRCRAITLAASLENLVETLQPGPDAAKGDAGGSQSTPGAQATKELPQIAAARHGREQQMTRKLSIGVVSVALLMSGAMVGVSSGGSAAGITDPEVMELTFEDERIEFFALNTFDGEQRGQLTWIKRSLFDADGNLVGTQRVECTAIIAPAWICTTVNSIKDGPNTDKGTIVATGVYNGFAPSSTFAVTGGTGAYNNVGGRAKQVDNNYTLYLVP